MVSDVVNAYGRSTTFGLHPKNVGGTVITIA